MTLYTLAEIKKEITKIEKSGGGVTKVILDVQEFGEGFDTSINVYYVNKYGHSEFESFQTGEEEPKSKALAKAKRQAESLSGRGFKVENIGLTNC